MINEQLIIKAQSYKWYNKALYKDNYFIESQHITNATYVYIFLKISSNKFWE